MHKQINVLTAANHFKTFSREKFNSLSITIAVFLKKLHMTKISFKGTIIIHWIPRNHFWVHILGCRVWVYSLLRNLEFWKTWTPSDNLEIPPMQGTQASFWEIWSLVPFYYIEDWNFSANTTILITNKCIVHEENCLTVN